MDPSLTFQLKRLIRGARILAHGRLRCLELARSIVVDRKGLEIGGPSHVFGKRHNLPLYDAVSTLDNCDFSQDTGWANHKNSYCFHPKKPCGKTFITEGNQLDLVPDYSYDFLLSSHNLEHFANPVKALKEWQRVVKPGGHLIVVLPHYKRTFDRNRTPTPIQHMFEDFERGIGEDDLTHVEEVLKGQRHDHPSGSEEEERKGLLRNFEHRMMHHHVFDEANSRELFEAVGFKVLAQETQLPFHIYHVLQLP
jgi:SAM-dependent methyltransferase